METRTYLKNLNEIKKSCEKLVTETQYDIEFFRCEQQQLQRQIQEILVEDSLINSRLEFLKNATAAQISPTATRTRGEARDDATREKITYEAFCNIKKQREYLQTENNDLRSLIKTHQRTIENLEIEIENYRSQIFKPNSVCEVKHKYTTAIQLLEGTINHKNSELKEQLLTIKDLIEQKKQLTERVEKADTLLQEKSEELEKLAGANENIRILQEQISETERQNKDLQKALEISRQTIEERCKREQGALQKVHEALAIAEAAEADKQEALKREKVVKEECDNIASTIGRVMDEAARKVENDMEAIKIKYIEKEKALIDEKNDLVKEIHNQKKFIQILDKRGTRYHQKCIDVAKDNDNLSVQLKQAANAVWGLEDQIRKLENKTNVESLEKSSIDEDEKFQQFIKSNHQLREKYRVAITDLTEKFENKIYGLQEEVTRLKAENEALKLQENI